MARSKAYRWGEEGIAGISDDKQLLCFAVSFWNKKDPNQTGWTVLIARLLFPVEAKDKWIKLN
jgi:hypothetical protein